MSTILREFKKLDSQGINRTYVEYMCDFCDKLHSRPKKDLKDFNFCSPNCWSNYRSKGRIEVECAYCHIKFRKKQSTLRNSRSGLYFCSRKCKDHGQRIESNIQAIQPDHYGNGDTNYRAIAFRALPNKCNVCGYDKYPVLDVHHKDRNRDNNHLGNLEILCPTCHMVKHYLSKTGRYSSIGGEHG